MTLEEIVKSIADTVKESVTYAIGGVYEKYDARFSDIESQIKSIPAPEKGDKGDSVTVDDIRPIIEDLVKSIEAPKGEKGDSVTIEEIRPMVEELVGSIDIPKGEKGDSVTLDDVAPVISEAIKEAISSIEIKEPDISHLEEAVKEAIESIPEVSDGKDGINGKDGENGKNGLDGISPSADDVAKSMEHIFAKWALDFERKADAVLEKAIDRMPKPKDGRDAIDIDGFDMVLGDDDRTITLSLKRGETVIEKSIKVPNIIDKGVFKHNATYEKGDAVTFGGCLWICQENTTKNEPSSANDFWRLAVKRGRDGREVVKVDLPETVKVKKDNEDA